MRRQLYERLSRVLIRASRDRGRGCSIGGLCPSTWSRLTVNDVREDWTERRGGSCGVGGSSRSTSWKSSVASVSVCARSRRTRARDERTKAEPSREPRRRLASLDWRSLGCWRDVVACRSVFDLRWGRARGEYLLSDSNAAAGWQERGQRRLRRLGSCSRRLSRSARTFQKRLEHARTAATLGTRLDGK